jgi:hypothetical protein
MKKFLTALCISFMAITYSNAEILSVGVSGNIGLLTADGKESVSGTSERQVVWKDTFADAKTAGTRDTKTSEGEEKMAMGYVSLFSEIHLGDTGLRLGVNYVPYALESEATDNKRNDNCSQPQQHLTTGSNVCSETNNKVQVDLEDMYSLYVAYHFNVEHTVLDSVFVKAGVIDAQVITKELLNTGSSYGNSSLTGEFVGFGIEKSISNGFFIRGEGNVTRYDDIRLTNGVAAGHENTNTINITNLDGATAVISVGRSF